MEITKPLTVEIMGENTIPLRLFDLARDLLDDDAGVEISYSGGRVFLHGIWEPNIDLSINELETKFNVKIQSKNLKIELIKENENVLEPILKLVVTVKEEHVGDVVGDINRRLALILEMEEAGSGLKAISSHAPLAALIGYSSDLSKITNSTGRAQAEFYKYDICPTDPSGPNPDEPASMALRA